jgi:hypothetical protein
MWIGVAAILVGALYSDISRFRNPDGEKYMVGYYHEGQQDFTRPYLSARALLAHQNPYKPKSPEFMHPIFGAESYPPGHILMDVPLALIYGTNVMDAARAFFHISLIALAVLGVITWRLLASIRGEPVSPYFALFAILCFTIHSGMQSGLERGQSDMITAALSWGAVLAFVRRRMVVAFFLVVVAGSLKGYPILLALGMVAIAATAATWRRRAFIGAAAGAAVFVLPMVRYLRYALHGVEDRGAMFWPVWFNHSFKNTVFAVLGAGASDAGARVLDVAGLAVAALWGWRAFAERKDASPGRLELTLVTFGTVCLLVVIGHLQTSVAYNLIVVIPGVTILVACQDVVAEALAIGRVGRHVVGAALTVSSFMIFHGRWNEHLTFPLAGVGLVILLGALALLGGYAVRGALASRSRQPVRVPASG